VTIVVDKLHHDHVTPRSKHRLMIVQL